MLNQIKSKVANCKGLTRRGSLTPGLLNVARPSRTVCASALLRGSRIELESVNDRAQELYLIRPGLGGFGKCNFVRDKQGHAIEEDYLFVDESLDKAGMSQVKIAYHRKTGRKVAIKIADKCRTQEVDALTRELEFLKVTDHPHVIRLYETYEDGEKLCIVLEFCEGGDLHDHIHYRHQGGLDFKEEELKDLARAMFRAVAYCHSHSIVHRDIKPSNFMFAPRLKLLDFGLGGVVPGYDPSSRLLKVKTGTAGYMAPEVIKGERYGPAADLFSLGATLFHMITGHPPIWIDAVGVYSFPKASHLQNLSEEGLQLLSSLLARNPKSRPTAAGALGSSWLANENRGRDPVNWTHLNDVRVQAIQHHRNRSKLQRCARTSMLACNSLHTPELQHLESEFLDISKTSDGEIHREELKATLRLKSSLHAEALLKSLDDGGDGTLCFSEWLVAASSREVFSCRKSAQLAFDMIDSDGDGLITAEELREVLPQVFSENELIGEMLRYDKNGDGCIDFEEFCDLLKDETPAVLNGQHE